TTTGAYEHQDLPFEKLVDELQPVRDVSHTPLFQVMFAMQNAMIPDLRVAGLEISPINVATDTAKFDLMLSVEAAAEGLKTAVEFSTDLFEAQTVRRLLRHYEALLESIVACPDERISRLRLLTREELDSISEKWASSREEPVNGLTIVEAFEEQARRRTD